MLAKITVDFSVTDEDGITWSYTVGQIIDGWQAQYAYNNGYGEVFNPSVPETHDGR